jgi:hypothetical protein
MWDHAKIVTIPLTILMPNDAIPSSECFSFNVPSLLLNNSIHLVHQGYRTKDPQTRGVEQRLTTDWSTDYTDKVHGMEIIFRFRFLGNQG